MAIIDQLGSKAMEKVADTKFMRNAALMALQAQQGKMNDDNEYIMLADIKEAMLQIPKQREAYKKIRKHFGANTNEEMLNIDGIYHSTLEFYNKYLKSNSLTIILKGKTDKVIDNKTKVYVKNGEKEEEKKINVTLLKEIQKFKSLYGTVGVNITNVGESVEELEYQVIEPFRYILKDNELYIFTYKGTDDTKDYFSIIKRTISTRGNVKEEKYNATLDAGNILETTETITKPTKIDELMFYEIINNTIGRSDISDIKNELFMTDVIETVKAVEIKASKFSIHADSRYFEDGAIDNADIYRIYPGATDDGEKPLFEAFQPNLREDSYIKYKNDYLQSMCIDLGMSARSLGFVTVEQKVATVALLDEEKTTETINAAKEDFREQFSQILINLYGESCFFSLTDYQPQSLAFKAQIIQQINTNMSTEKIVEFLYPDLEESDRMREIVLLKTQKGELLTDDEEKVASEIGLLKLNE